MTPLPIYTFLVNSIDYQTIYSQPLPDKIDNIVGSLNKQSVYIPYVNRPLKNGDIFTLYGKRAQTVYNMFINKYPKVLEIVANTNDIPSLITNGSKFDLSSLPIRSALSSYYEKYVVNYSGGPATFSIQARSKNDTFVDFSLKINDISAGPPSTSFPVTVQDRTVVTLTTSAESNFYVVYEDLHF